MAKPAWEKPKVVIPAVQEMSWGRKFLSSMKNKTRKLLARRSRPPVMEKRDEDVRTVGTTHDVVTLLGTPLVCGLLLVLSYYTLFVRKRANRSNKGSNAKRVPVGPSLREFVGGGFSFRRLRKEEGFHGSAAFPIRRSTTHMTESYEKWNKEYGLTYRVSIPLVSDLVVTSDLTTIRDLFQQKNNMYRSTPTHFGRSSLFSGSLGDAMGSAVATLLDVPEWRWRKDSLLKEFHKARLMAPNRQLVEYVVKAGNRMCRSLEQAADASPNVTTITPLTVEATSSVIFFFLFGKEVEYDVQEFWGASLYLLEFFRYRIGAPFHALFKHIPGTEAYKEERQKQRAWKQMDAVYADHVRKAIADQRHASPSATAASKSSDDALPALASLLAKEPRYLEQPSAEERLIEETRVLVEAGFETTSNALAFAIGILAERPDIGDQLAVEASAILGPSKTQPQIPSRETLETATISRNLFLEAVRLYPLVAAISGQVGKEDIVVKTSDPSVQYTISRGTPVACPTRVLQTDPRHVKGTNPLEVDVHRWKDPETSPSMITFGMGAHACPGKNLAILEGQIMLLMVARQFRLERVAPDGSRGPNAASGLPHEEISFLRPKNGLTLRVFRRREGETVAAGKKS